jgi:hypothetical protein
MSGFISSSPFQNTKRFLQIQSLAPGIARRKFGAVPTPATTPASNYSQSVYRLRNPRVPLRSSRRGLRRSAFGLSIGSPNLRQSTDLASAPARVFFPGEKPPLLHLGFLRLFVFPSVQSISRSPLTFPGGGGPSPSVSPPRRRLFSPPRRRRRWPTAALALPRPTPARTPPGSGGRAPRAPCGRAHLRPAQPRPPLRSPLFFPSSLFHGWEEEDEERKKTMAVS